MPVLAAEAAWGLFWEQGCAKTRPTIEDAERCYHESICDSLLIIGTAEAATNWVSDELPEWLSPDLYKRSRIHLYQTKKAATKGHQRELAALFRHKGFRILSMSYDALCTDRGRDAAWELLKGRRCYMVIDEAADIKTEDTKRAKKVHGAGPYAVRRRALEGTPITQGPFDVYSIIKFLDPLFWERNGFGSFTAFKNHFGVFVDLQESAQGYGAMVLYARPCGHPDEQGKLPVARRDGTVRMAKPNALGRVVAEDGDITRYVMVNRTQGPAVERPVREDGTVPFHNGDSRRFQHLKSYRRLDELTTLLKKISSRMLKEDCLDLPPKLYEKVRFDLSPEQRALYDQMKAQQMAWLDSGKSCPGCEGTGWAMADLFNTGELQRFECSMCGGVGKVDARTATAELPIVRDLRLQQIAAGYVPVDNFGVDADGMPPEPLHIIPGPNPRLEALIHLMERNPRKGILWGNYRYDIDLMMKAAQELGRKVVQYDGRIGPEERLANKNAFQHGDVDIIVASSAMSRSVTVHAAWWMAYYNNVPRLRFRLQSEDRAHRAGLDHPLTIYDLIANDTIDEKWIENLRGKRKVARQVQDDREREWI